MTEIAPREPLQTTAAGGTVFFAEPTEHRLEGNSTPDAHTAEMHRSREPLLARGPESLEIFQDRRGGCSPAMEAGRLRIKDDSAPIEEES